MKVSLIKTADLFMQYKFFTIFSEYRGESGMHTRYRY